MSTLKRFKVEDESGNNEVTLEVDLQILTAEVATEINEFISSAGDRLADEDGDVIRVAVRMFGAYALQAMLGDGGADFHSAAAGVWQSRHIQDFEGMGGSDPSPYGYCGIRIVGANVQVPTFDFVSMEELPA